MLEGPHIVLAHFVAVHQDVVGSLVPVAPKECIPLCFQVSPLCTLQWSDTSGAKPGWIAVALALEHRIQPLAAAHDVIVTNLGPAEPEHLLLHDATGEGAL